MSSVYIAGDFVGNKTIVKQKFPNDFVKSIKDVGAKNRLSDYKTVLLINEGSASASEILAGALKYHQKYIIVGKKSFGKGVVQDEIQLSSGTGLHVTTSEWITPNDENIHGEGIIPDFIIERTEEDIRQGKDLQLDFAKKQGSR